MPKYMVNQRLKLSDSQLIRKHANRENQCESCKSLCESSYIVGKRRFSASKWYLVCENQLGIEATGAILIFTPNSLKIHSK